MSDEFEVANLREKLDQLLDPSYPNREAILDCLSYHTYHSTKHTTTLQEKFLDLYTGPKDKIEEFKVILGATALLAIGTPVQKVKDRLNKVLDFVDEVEQFGTANRIEDAHSATQEMKLGALVQDGASIAVKPNDADNIWQQRIDMGIENLDYKTLQGLPKNISVKIVVRGEAFWCEILERMSKGVYLVRVDNQLVMTHLHNLELDDNIVISYKNIMEISW
jgi:hypothetical protein